MKRVWMCLGFVILLGVCPVQADVLEQVEQVTGAGQLEQLIPPELSGQGVWQGSQGDLWGALLGFFQKCVSGLLGPALGFFGSLTVLLLTAAVLERIKESLPAATGQPIFDFVVLVSVASYVFGHTGALLEQVRAHVGAVCDFMLSLLPVTGALWVAGGTPACGSVQGAGLMLVLDVFMAVSDRVLVPLVNVLFGLCVAGALLGGIPRVVRAVKKAFVTLCVFFMTLTLTLLGVQTSLAKSADSVALRSVKFAFSGFVPVIGSLVGESTRTVAAAVGFLKSSVGVFGVGVVLFMLCRPLVSIVLYKTALWAVSLLAQLCSCTRLGGFLEEVNELLGLLLALVLSVSVYFILALCLFCQTPAVSL